MKLGFVAVLLRSCFKLFLQLLLYRIMTNFNGPKARLRQTLNSLYTRAHTVTSTWNLVLVDSPSPSYDAP